MITSICILWAAAHSWAGMCAHAYRRARPCGMGGQAHTLTKLFVGVFAVGLGKLFDYWRLGSRPALSHLLALVTRAIPGMSRRLSPRVDHPVVSREVGLSHVLQGAASQWKTEAKASPIRVKRPIVPAMPAMNRNTGMRAMMMPMMMKMAQIANNT